MGQIVEIGPVAGKAAPGEFSPAALLTSPGGIIIANASGVPVQLAPPSRGAILIANSTPLPAWLARPSAGLFLGSDGSDVIGRYAPGHLLFSDNGSTYTGNGSTTPETHLLSGGAAVSCFPAAIAVGDMFRVRAHGSIRISSGTASTFRVRCYYGTYAFMDITTNGTVTAGTARRAWMVELEMVVTGIAGANSGEIRVMGTRSGLFAQNTPSVAADSFDGVSANAGAYEVSDAGALTPTVATNAAQNFDITVVHGNNQTTQTTVLNMVQVRYYPKNY
jgi:hypothetical protein